MSPVLTSSQKKSSDLHFSYAKEENINIRRWWLLQVRSSCHSLISFVLIFSAGLESAQYHTAFLFHQSWRWFVIFFFSFAQFFRSRKRRRIPRGFPSLFFIPLTFFLQMSSSSSSRAGDCERPRLLFTHEHIFRAFVGSRRVTQTRISKVLEKSLSLSLSLFLLSRRGVFWVARFPFLLFFLFTFSFSSCDWYCSTRRCRSKEWKKQR